MRSSRRRVARFPQRPDKNAAMPSTVELTLACGDYEITRPLKEGVVRPDGIDLKVVTAMDSPTRHWRFLRNHEFDMAEVSSSSYVAARDNGLPFRAIPVFPHRRFRHGFIYINTTKGIAKPADLAGRKVGVKFFLNSAALWLRGILQHEYNVPFTAMDWVTELDEDIDSAPPAGVRLTRAPKGKSIVGMLLDGEIDALLHPDLIKPVLGLKQEIVEKYPWVPVNMFMAFNEAKAVAMKRMENPRIVPLAWYREAWEEQQEILGRDPWEYGLTERNRKNLETLVGYSQEQGLIKRRIPLDELFLSVSQGTGRGD